MSLSKLLLRASALGALCVAGQAQALTFVLNNTGGAEVGTRARQGFEIATRYWSSVLTDNVSVNLNIGFTALGTGILGQTGSARSLLSMAQGYTALARDATSTLDAAAVASLRPLGVSAVDPSFGAVTAVTNAFNNGVDGSNGYTDLSTRIDNDGSVNNSTLAVTKASAKALGLTTDVNGNAINYGSADGSITFSSAFSFDFDPSDGIDGASFDFIGVAIHEIGHALGFVSGVDGYDARTAPGQTNAASLTSLEGFVVMSQLDLFRYSSAGTLDWSTQNTPYFSVDGGATQLFGDSRFSTGTLNGDGRQASHWKDSAAGVPQLGVMDPTSGRGQLQEVTDLDIAAFDAIGWNTRFDPLLNQGYRYSTADAYRAFVSTVSPVVPEPATWGMMILGFGAVGGAMRVRRRQATIRFAA